MCFDTFLLKRLLLHLVPEVSGIGSWISMFAAGEGKAFAESLIYEKGKEKVKNKRDRFTYGIIIRIRTNAIAPNFAYVKSLI